MIFVAASFSCLNLFVLERKSCADREGLRYLLFSLRLYGKKVFFYGKTKFFRLFETRKSSCYVFFGGG